jgi:hypothetical protein
MSLTASRGSAQRDKSGGPRFAQTPSHRMTTSPRPTLVCLLLAVDCAHQRDETDRPRPTAARVGCYRVELQRPLRTPFPVPTQLELRPEPSHCPFARHDFDALADIAARRGPAHGHWSPENDNHVHVAWGGDFYGVAVEVADRDGELRGTAVTFQDVGGEFDRVKAALVRQPCSPPAAADHTER